MVDLGDKVKDTVSGFTGIVISKTFYLQGCARICVHPRVDKNGKLPTIGSFDEPQVKVIKKGAVKPGGGITGGVAYAQPSEKDIVNK